MTTLRNFQDVELEVKRTNLEVDRLLADVRLILDRINHITGISGSFSASPSLATNHGILTGLGDDDHPHYLLASGTRELTGNWDAGPFSITAETLISDVAIGTAPLTVTSTTIVPNLNVDQVDGFHLDQDVTSGASPTFDGANFTGIDISDATNLAGGSGITLNDDTVDLDINSLAVATIAAGDFIPFWDITVTADNKKITFANFEATLDHGAIAGIGDDDHTQYILVAGTRPFTGNQSFGDFNITDVGSISLDSIIGDGTTITIGGTPSIVLTDVTTIAVTLGSDPGDDFTIDSTAFAVEGDTGFVGIGTASPGVKLEVTGSSYIQSATSHYITFLGSSSSASGSSILLRDEGEAAGLKNWYIRSVNSDFEIGTATDGFAYNVAKLHIEADGKFGIGTLVPQTLLQVGAGVDAPFQSYEGIYTAIDGIAQITCRNNSDDVEVGMFAHSNLNAYIGTWTNHKLHIRTNNTDAIVIETSGDIGVRIASPDGTFHIHTATAGSVTASGSANELVLENSGDCGMSILAPDVSTSAVVFGSPGDLSGAWVSWNFNSKLLIVGSTTASGEARINTGAGTLAMYMDSSQNIGIRTATAFGSGAGVLGIADASTNPSTNPAGGGVLYSDGGAGKWRSSGGTTTTFGNAEPHCKVCDRDFVLEWENKKTGYLAVCMWCLTEKLGEEKWITKVN